MSFLKTLEMLAGGRVLQDCEDGIADVVAAVKATGGKGEIVLKMKVNLHEADGQTTSVNVSGDVSVKCPRPARGAATFYVRKDGALSTRDPRQPALPGMPEEEDVEGSLRGLSVIDGQRRASGETA